MRHSRLYFTMFFLSAFFAAFAEYTDENGIRRVGPPGSFSPGYRDANGVYREGDPPPGTKVMNSKGKIVTTPEKMLSGEIAPSKYNEDCLRVIQNKVYDFSAVANWANEYAYLLSKGPKPITPSGFQLPIISTKNSPSKPQVADWETRWKQSLSDAEKYGSYFLAGKVKQVISDGVIIEAIQPGTTTKISKILKNYPLKDQVADGDPLEVLALPSGQYTNKNLGQRMIHAYDFGRLATVDDSDLDKVSVP
jgi:hypothetical protein